MLDERHRPHGHVVDAAYGDRDLPESEPLGILTHARAISPGHPWDITRYLKSDEHIAAYLDAALDKDDPALLAAALGDGARAKGMTMIARETGLGRESLYEALSSSGNPEFATARPSTLRPSVARSP